MLQTCTARCHSDDRWWERKKRKNHSWELKMQSKVHMIVVSRWVWIETRNKIREFIKLIRVSNEKSRTYPLIFIGVSLIYDLSSQLISADDSRFHDILSFVVRCHSEKWMKSLNISSDMRRFRLSRTIIKFVWTFSSFISWYDTIYSIVSFTHL